jgi:hypothetical protein
MVPEALESLTPEERHRIYKMFRLDVAVNAGGEIEVTGDLVAGPEVCNTGPAPWRSWGKSDHPHQHGAHKRILYEKLLQNIRGTPTTLSAPTVVRLPDDLAPEV